MKTRLTATLFAAALVVQSAVSQTLFYGGTGALNGATSWSTTSGGPYNTAFIADRPAQFEGVNLTATTGGSLQFSSITATANLTITSPSGTFTNTANGVIPVTVNAGVTLDFGSQAMTGSGTAGYIKNGPGVYASAGGNFGGGFTLNDGTMVVRGVNAMGNAAGNVLTINGGTLVPNATRDLSGRYGGGIVIGGNFTVGTTASSVGTITTSPTANLTFSNNTALGVVGRVMNIGGNGTYTLGGVISNGGSFGIDINAIGSATGNFTFSGVNTYGGSTRINSGTLNANTPVSGTNSALGTGGATIFSGGTLGGTGSAVGPIVLLPGARVTGGLGNAVNQTLTVGVAAGQTISFSAGTFYRAAVAEGSGVSDTTLTGSSLIAMGTMETLFNPESSTPSTGIGDALNFELIGTTPLPNGTYTRRIGTFAAIGTGLTAAASGGVIDLRPSDNDLVRLTTAGFMIDPATWSINIGGTPNEVRVTFTVVPEPTTLFASLAAIGGLGTVLRRKNRKTSEAQR